MSVSRSRTDYGVRSFDLSIARDNQRIDITADNLAILEAGDNATIRINDPQNSEISVRDISSISIPPKDGQEGIQRIYLSNPAGTGQLRLLSGFAGASGSTSTPSDSTTDVSDRAARELGKTRLEDSSGVLIDPLNPDQVAQVSDSTTTATNYATVNLGPTRTAVGIVADVSGSATLSVEVSESGDFAGEEHAVDSISYSGASTNLEQYDFAYQHVRASVNQNLTELEIVGRGI